MTISALRPTIEALWDRRDSLNSSTTGADRDAVEAVLAALDAGTARAAEKIGHEWVVNEWLMQLQH